MLLAVVAPTEATCAAAAVVVVGPIAAAAATGIPCGGRGGGISSLSFRAEVTVDVSMDGGVGIVVADTTVDGFDTCFVTKLFRGILSLLQ